MKKINENDKNEIISLVNKNVSINDIIKQFNISKATYYRIIKNKNEPIDDENKSVVSFNDDVEIINSDNTNNTLSEHTENEHTETDDNESDIQKQDDFNENLFIKQLNNDISINTYNNNNDNDSIKSLSVKSVKSVKSNTSLKTKNKNNVIETIQNLECNNVDELKERRKQIIIIRQYLNTFPNELKSLYINKTIYEKKLYNLSIEQLRMILENIRVLINLNRNRSMFQDIMKITLTTGETILNKSGLNIIAAKSFSEAAEKVVKAAGGKS